jgi:hypothetical protein
MVEYKCEECGKSFDSERNLSMHRQQEHQSISQERTSGSESITRDSATVDRFGNESRSSNKASDQPQSSSKGSATENAKAGSRSGKSSGDSNIAGSSPSDKSRKSDKKGDVNQIDSDANQTENTAKGQL